MTRADNDNRATSAFKNSSNRDADPDPDPQDSHGNFKLDDPNPDPHSQGSLNCLLSLP